MQNASHPQKAGRGGARRALRAAPFLAIATAARETLAEDQASGTDTEDAFAATAWGEPIEIAYLEGGEFIPAAAQPAWSPAAVQPGPAPPVVPLGARSSEAPAGEGVGGIDGPGAITPRVSEGILATAREQLLASLPFPGFVPVDADEDGPGLAGAPPADPDPAPDPEPGPEPGPDPTPAPEPAGPNVVRGESPDGAIATLTITRRVAPDWVREAVGDDTGIVRFIAPTTAGLPESGKTRPVSVSWADIDGDGQRDGHLYRIDNGHDLAVTISVGFVNGAMLPGSATVEGDSAAFIWVPITTGATLRFHGTDTEGAAVDWTRNINTQNQSDMRTTTVTHSAWAGEVHEATGGSDVFLFGPGDGVDAILGYDPVQDSVVLPTDTAARVVSIFGTAGVIVGNSNREGLVFDGIAFSPTLTLSDLNVLFA